ncbi:MAG: hypothetical protein GF411_10225 [Candidatus Lokiarchaeota archaeon]|nr:hypothetical protein [Candidatus Lokiarchaeota archaeon]
MSELKCCKKCGAYQTCNHKGECCIECQYFDPIDRTCLAVHRKKVKKVESSEEDDEFEFEEEVDPDTFLFEDDDLDEEEEDFFDDEEDEEDDIFELDDEDW